MTRIAVIVGLAWLGAVTPLLAQSEPRASVSGLIGAASDSSETGATVGGAFLFDVHERLSIEGQGSYLGRGEGADAFSFLGSVLLNLLPATETLVPYAAAGAGFYHVAFDLDRPRFFGPPGMAFPSGTVVCPAPGSGFGVGRGPGFRNGGGTCPASAGGYWGVGALPNFYARRLDPFHFPAGGAWGRRDFTDPALSLGGGLRINVTERLMVRPDARALVFFGDGESHSMGIFVVHVGYRF